MPPRSSAIASATAWFDGGGLFAELSRRVGIRTESQNRDCADSLACYLTDEIAPAAERLGFRAEIWDNPVAGGPPFLFAERSEGEALPTVLTYGTATSSAATTINGATTALRGSSSRPAIAGTGAAPQTTRASTPSISRRWGRCSRRAEARLQREAADRDGRGSGLAGLRKICQGRAKALRSDVLIASDGPRLRSDLPTIFLGSRGAFNFDLVLELREGAHHSGNWGGLLANPGIVLANAIASMVDARGRILVAGLTPSRIPTSVRRALRSIEPGEPAGPAIDAHWGEPGLTPAERVFGWNSLEVLAFKTGNPERPVNAIPRARPAHMQIRFVAGCDVRSFVPAMRKHLDQRGFAKVEVRAADVEPMEATRPRPQRSMGPMGRGFDRGDDRYAARDPAESRRLAAERLLRRRARSADDLGSAFLPACSQHAPDEHLLVPVAREALAIMTGLFWDLGEAGSAPDRKPSVSQR
jgi:acetylornithine deacetylase/succinyl-diaminopimelate desuccinylase-like protein